VFTFKACNTFLNIGALSQPDFSPAGFRSSPLSNRHCYPALREKHIKITGWIEMYKEKPKIRINAAEQLEVE